MYWSMSGEDVSMDEGEEDGWVVGPWDIIKWLVVVERFEERVVAHLLVASLSDDSRCQAQTDAETGKSGLNRRSFRRRTREQATNVRPAENSLLPMSMTTLSRVRP